LNLTDSLELMTPHSYIMIDGTFGWTAQSVY